MSDSVTVCATAIQGPGIALVSMPFTAGYLVAADIAAGILPE